MSEECLTRNQLDRLAAGKLRGRELARALAHLETCEHCQSCARLPAPEEILARIFDEPPEETKTGAATGENETGESSHLESNSREKAKGTKSENDFGDFLRRIRDRRENS